MVGVDIEQEGINTWRMRVWRSQRNVREREAMITQRGDDKVRKRKRRDMRNERDDISSPHVTCAPYQLKLS